MTAADRMSAAEFRAMTAKPRNPRNKFNAKRTISDLGAFDSKGEHDQFHTLMLLERAGQIRDIKRQQKFPLTTNGVPVVLISKNGRKTQSVYIADFTYYELPAETFVVADFKGIDTKVSQLKRAILQTMLPDARIVVQYAKSNSPRRSPRPKKSKK